MIEWSCPQCLKTVTAVRKQTLRRAKYQYWNCPECDAEMFKIADTMLSGENGIPVLLESSIPPRDAVPIEPLVEGESAFLIRNFKAGLNSKTEVRIALIWKNPENEEVRCKVNRVDHPERDYWVNFKDLSRDPVAVSH
jgi:hypothetical protein